MKTFLPVVRTAVAALSLALAACENPFGEGHMPVTFSPRDRPTPNFFVESTRPGIVTIHGTYGISGCNEYEPDARMEGSTLVFHLEKRSGGGGDSCPMHLMIMGYRAEVSRLKGGTYHVRVEHVGTTDHYDGVERPNGVRFEGDVMVQ